MTAPVFSETPNQMVLLSGNEAVARGAIEAGVDYSTAYPGSPSSEILPVLAQAAKTNGGYAEWSTNEKVALEGALAASLAGLRAVTIMKHAGLNVASDVLSLVNLTGVKGGLVIVVSDDPSAHSSASEEDTRHFARLMEVPLIEPSTFQEAKDMVRSAFELSESTGLAVMVRLVTRLCHARGNVVLGEIPRGRRKAFFNTAESYVPNIRQHASLHQKIERLKSALENNPWNLYEGPERPEVLVITSGVGLTYTREAVESLGLGERVAIARYGLTWPLPPGRVLRDLGRSDKVLFIEEIDPFLEESVLVLAAQNAARLGQITFLGKGSGDVAGPVGPALGELNPDLVRGALAKAAGVQDSSGQGPGLVSPGSPLLSRELAFCTGCPHRATFWNLKTALALDGRDGFVVGDIGCYTLGTQPTGFNMVRIKYCMGAAVGIADAFGKMRRFGMNQPVVAVVGDSTFYHATNQALLNARHTDSEFLLAVLDNSTTAMTGFQPHAGSPTDAMGLVSNPITIEGVLRGYGLPVEICDPFDFERSTDILGRLLVTPGLKAVIFRRTCALVEARSGAKPIYVVNQAKCIGDDCGCARFCVKGYSCPANVWDEATGTAAIDPVLCSGCGLCARFCPAKAISVVGGDTSDQASA